MSTHQPIQISKQTARRYVMGRQGLWPGRRWQGKAGTEQAIRACEAVQLDPLNVIARSHDIVLHSRVADYQPSYVEELMYGERRFFDYGGSLFFYPMEELPYWHLHMKYFKSHGRWADFAAKNSDLLDSVRAAIRERGPLGNRDFDGPSTVKGNYRGRKESSLALYAMWITGEVMVHHRERFERVYDFRENVAPPEYLYEASLEDAERYFAGKSLRFYGLVRERGFANTVGDFLMRKIDKMAAQAWLDRLVEQGDALPVQVEGWKEIHYAPGEDRGRLDLLEAGGMPEDWKPVISTDEEVTILAPLEIVSARGRAKNLFGFEYIWEVYKPVELRRWGYYTIPFLYGDRLVGRLDPRLDRASKTLRVLGFWLEPDAPENDSAFAEALARGLERFARFAGAEQIDAQVMPEKLRAAIKI